MAKKYKPKTSGNMIDLSRFSSSLSKEYNLQSYGIKNFKSWKDSGLIDFKRLNLVFGQNSAGKSALIQSILSTTKNLDSLNYEKEQGAPDFLELFSKTIDLGNFAQVHRANKSNIGIVTTYKSNSNNVTLKAEYSEDPVSQNPRLKSYEFSFKSSPLRVNTRVKRKKATSERRWDTSRPGKQGLVYLDGSIKIKPLKISNVQKKDLDPILIGKSSSIIDCSSLSLREEEGANLGFQIPELDNIFIIDDYRSRGRKFFGPEVPTLIGSYEGKGYASEELDSELRRTQSNQQLNDSRQEGRDVARYVDWNLGFLARIIQAAEKVFIGHFVHIPPIRGIPSRISTTQDIAADPSVAYVYRKWEGLSGLRFGKRKVDLSKLKKLVNDDFKELGLPYTVDVRSDSFNGVPLTNVMIIDGNKKELSLLDVGRGISQLLPIIVSAHSETDASILVEQPEVHIHPKLQADLADIFVNSTNNQWVIETHSENVLFRIQKRIREGVLDPSEVQCIYVSTKDGSAHPLTIGFNGDGSLDKDFPPGFFDIGLDELIP